MFNGGWVYLGCANETKPRALPAAGYANRTGMTVESCQSFCSKDTNNYGLAGLEYGGILPTWLPAIGTNR